MTGSGFLKPVTNGRRLAGVAVACSCRARRAARSRAATRTRAPTAGSDLELAGQERNAARGGVGVEHADGRRLGGTASRGLSVAAGKAPVLAGVDDREPVTGRTRAEIVALVHAREQDRRPGEVGEAVGGPNPRGHDPQVAAVRLERHDRARPPARRHAVVAGRGHAHDEAAVRRLHDVVVLAARDRAVDDDLPVPEPAAVESGVLGHPSQRAHDQPVSDPDQPERCRQAAHDLLWSRAGPPDEVDPVAGMARRAGGRGPQPALAVVGERRDVRKAAAVDPCLQSAGT